MENKKDKKIIWERTKNLQERKIWIGHDMTWKKREIGRRLVVIVVEEKKKEKNTWMEGKTIRIKGEVKMR